MKRTIAYIILVLISILIVVGFIAIKKFNKALFQEKSNYLTYSFEPKPIHFDWVNDSIGGHYETQTAMIIPLQIKGLAHRFYMQFDTGSPHSYVYEKDLNSLKALGLNTTEIVKDGASYVEKLELMLGGNRVQIAMIKILKGYGHRFDNSDTIPNIGIGTIGSDFLANHITSIDFKNQEIAFYNNRPEWMSSLSAFNPFSFKGRRIMLPTAIDNVEFEFLYDSGCSAFGLITTKNRYQKYSEEITNEIPYDANSWGKGISMRSKKTDKIFTIGNTDLSLNRVTYVDMYTVLQRFVTPFTRVGGWLGNQPFIESTLILDAKKEEFIVLKD